MREQDLSNSELERRLHASVLKREAWKEKEIREAKEARDAETMLGFGGTDMTKQELKKLIDSDRRMYYRTEELNDKLYIQYKGWKSLQNLEGWTGLRALYAECNAFDCIQGLATCRNLRSLFLQENCVRRISGLEGCPELYNLNLSSNFIESIEGLSHLKKLNTLVIAKNKIGFKGVDDVAELLDCPSLGTVDIQDNKIWDPDVLPEVFSRMGDLRVLYLKGNPCCKAIPNYRKSTTVYCSELRYLDDRPVFPDDRRAAEAFNRGGLEEERAERRRIKQEASEKHDRNMRAFAEMVASARSEKRERDAMRAEDKFTDETDPVESQERRMQHQVDEWKEKHAEELKDDMKEYAERCLKAEREGQQGAVDPPPVAAGAEEQPTAAAGGGPAPAEAGAAAPPEEEERRLVYEDIWDDVPQAPSAPPIGTAAPGAAERDSPREPRAELGGAPVAGAAAPGTAQSEGIFLPWAAGGGVVGMDSVSASGAAVERRAARLRAEEARPPEREAAGAGGPGSGWYSKFAERVQAEAPAGGAGRRQGTAQGEAPRARRPGSEGEPSDAAADGGGAAAGEGAELNEMD